MDEATRQPTDSLAGIAESTIRAHTIADGAAIVCRGLSALLPGSPVLCLIHTHHQSALHLCLGRSVGRKTAEAVLHRFRDHGGPELRLDALHLQEEISSSIAPGWHINRATITPVRTQDLVRGLLLAGREETDPSPLLDEAATRLAPVLLGLDRLLYEARTDPVSGLFNRLFLNEALAREYAQAQRHAYPLGLLLLDVDNFKHLNDAYGHPAGDEALHHIGIAVRDALRAGDLACRYGGDEFAILLPHTDLAGARRAAERVIENVAHFRVHAGDHRIGLTVSIGFAAYDPAAAPDQTASLLNLADRSLYRAKAERDARLQA